MDIHAPTLTIYPSMISRACAALDESHLFKDMPDGFIRIVFRLVKKINLANPYSPIFASRGTIATESGKSIETVQRAVKWLEDHSFIEREQIANPGKRGSKSPITPTRVFLDALGLLEKPAPQAARPGVDRDPADPRKAKAATERAKKLFTRIGSLAIPQDLAWLCANGVSAPGVLKLMRLAKNAKQRLSDVVTATKAYLEELSGRELYAYIQALLGKNKDFSRVSSENEETSQSEQERVYLREKAELLDGRTFSNRDGSTTIRIESGALAVTANGRRVMHLFSMKFLDAIDAGRMREAWAHRE